MFDNGYSLRYINNSKTLEELIAQDDPDLNVFIPESVKSTKCVIPVNIKKEYVITKKDDVECDPNEVFDKFKMVSYNINPDRINRLIKSINKEIKIDFDVTVHNKCSEYLNYQVKLNNGDDVQDKLFMDIINELLIYTDKQYIKVEDKNGFNFKHPGGLITSIYKLSSGEKRMFIILLNMLLNSDECIYILDNVEESLHLVYQMSLIENIMRLNPKVQIILSTHGPEVVGNRRDKLIMLK